MHKELRFAQFHTVQTFILDRCVDELGDAFTKSI